MLVLDMVITVIYTDEKCIANSLVSLALVGFVINYSFN